MAWIFSGNTLADGVDSEKIPFIPLGEADSIDDQDIVSTTSQSLTKSWRPIYLKILGHCTNFGRELLPSFVVSNIKAKKLEPEKRKLHPTAFLDGIRGFACLFVVFFHLVYAWYPRHHYGFGYPGDGKNHYIIQLPIIKVIYSGASMVHVFFVVSGFALSYKSLKLLRNGSIDTALQSLVSSAFRRPFRIFLPPLTSTFIIVLLVRFGAYEPARPYAYDDQVIPDVHEDHVERFATFWEQLRHWVYHSHEMCGLFRWSRRNPYDGHLWTIPVEFHQSMLLFFTVLTLSFLRPVIRTILLASLAVYAAYVDPGPTLCFYAGMLTAELWLITSSRTTPSLTESRRKTILTRIEAAIWWIIFLAGLYLDSNSDYWEATPGYSFLARLHTNRDFWHTTGAFFIVFSASNSASIQKLFTNSFAQYLGKISYAVYLVHGMFLHTLVYILLPKVWEYTGKDTLAQYELGWGLVVALFLPCVIWAADLFWRWVDIPAVKFARKVEEMCSIRKGGR